MAKRRDPTPRSRRGKGNKPFEHGKTLASGEITLPPGAIPSPSGGRSSALDFTDALMRGNPVAEKAMRDALRETKEEASVADKFIASTYDWVKYFRYSANDEKKVAPILLAYRQAMRKANRFVLDDLFVEYATHLSNRVTPEKLLARIGLATLPYEVTWIEFDLHVKVRVMRQFHGLEGIPRNVSQRMGLLLERVNDTTSTVTMVGEQNDGITIPTLTGYIFTLDERTLRFDQMFNGLTPFDAAYRVDRLKKMPLFEDVMNDPDSSELMHRVAHGSLWGYAKDTTGVLHSASELIKHIRSPEFLHRHGQLAFTRFYDFFEDAGQTTARRMEGISNAISTEVTEYAGMMRWIVCVLAMLNEVPTRAEFVQPMHTMRWGLVRKVAAFDYHKLTLRLPKTRALPYLERKLSNVERKHKAHTVRQFWRTYLHVDNACKPDEHAWEYDNEHGYALCGKCFGYRRRIPEHVRGDPSLGWVSKEYVIKPSKQE